MEITRHGNKYNGSFWQIRCPECGCEFTAEQDDFRIEISEKNLKRQYYLHCPECEEKIYRPDCELASETNKVKSERDKRGKEIIEAIMESIDFEKIHRVMEYLRWEWWNEGVPSEDTIRKETEKRLWWVWTEKRSTLSGGIYIKYLPEEDYGDEGWSNEGLDFYFVLESGGAFHDEEGKLEYIP